MLTSRLVGYGAGVNLSPRRSSPLSPARRQYGNVADLATGDRYTATRAAIDMAAARREYTSGADRLQTGVESAAALYGMVGGVARMGGGNPCFPNSFAPDVHVLTPEGWRRIDEIEAGDRVWACRDRDGGACGWRRVQQVRTGADKHLVHLEVEYPDGTRDFLDATPGHPVYAVDVGWVDTADLTEADGLFTVEGRQARVVGVLPVAEPSTTFNLSVALAHTYFVSEDGEGDGVWVHNAGGPCAVPVGKLPRYQGQKPRYHVNDAHVPGRGLRPGKTPLPPDAEAVFRKAVPNSASKPSAWFGRNTEGRTYRFSPAGDGTAHFSGMDGDGDGIRNFSAYASQRLDGG